jgi:choline dehydrogenase-like flavoprotein
VATTCHQGTVGVKVCWLHAYDASTGVTDSFGRLFGTSNCFVASSAIFPTSGQANPTLPIVALTVRQAKHIAQLLNTKEFAGA